MRTNATKKKKNQNEKKLFANKLINIIDKKISELQAIIFKHAIQHNNKDEKAYGDLNARNKMMKSMMFHI